MKFKASQKFSVHVDNISFITTAKQIREDVGTTLSFNAALSDALEELEQNGTPNFGGRSFVKYGHLFMLSQVTK